MEHPVDFLYFLTSVYVSDVYLKFCQTWHLQFWESTKDEQLYREVNNLQPAKSIVSVNGYHIFIKYFVA